MKIMYLAGRMTGSILRTLGIASFAKGVAVELAIEPLREYFSSVLRVYQENPDLLKIYATIFPPLLDWLAKYQHAHNVETGGYDPMPQADGSLLNCLQCKTPLPVGTMSIFCDECAGRAQKAAETVLGECGIPCTEERAPKSDVAPGTGDPPKAQAEGFNARNANIATGRASHTVTGFGPRNPLIR